MNNNGDGAFKVIMGVAIIVMFVFMGWAVMEHYKDHDQHLRENYDQQMNDQRHSEDHNRILEGIDQHEDEQYRRDQEYSYYCPVCRKRVNQCPHYRHYDPRYRGRSTVQIYKDFSQDGVSGLAVTPN